MHRSTHRRTHRSQSLRPLALGTLATAAALLAPTRRLAAQAWFYPAFQPPRTVEREYNFAVAAAGGADFLFQWREGVAPGTQLSLDAGLADPTGPSNTRVFVGGQVARELTRATATQPLDLLVTGGVGLSGGSGVGLVRIPIGVSVGHTFDLEGGMSVTPYVHPRVSVDAWTGGSGANSGSQITLDFDVGANLAITSQLALRASLLFAGNNASSSTGFGIGLAIQPSALRPR